MKPTPKDPTTPTPSNEPTATSRPEPLETECPFKVLVETGEHISIREAVEKGHIELRMPRPGEFLERFGDRLLPPPDDPALRFDAISRCYYHDAAYIKEEKFDWLWDRYIPRGETVSICADPEVGKSMLSLYLAADWSRRGLRVGFLAEEDSLSTIVVPRLKFLKADLHNILFFAGDEDGKFDFNQVSSLERWVQSQRLDAAFIDPVDDYMPGAVNTWNKADVSRTLRKLSTMAKRLQVAIIYVAHLNKDVNKPLKYRIQGSIAFYSKPRFVIGMADHPTDPALRVVGSAKANPVGRTPSYNFCIEGDGERLTCVEFQGESEYEVRDLLSPQPDSLPRRAEQGKRLTDREVMILYVPKVFKEQAGKIEGARLMALTNAMAQADGHKAVGRTRFYEVLKEDFVDLGILEYERVGTSNHYWASSAQLSGGG
jgi:hypothetical protein